MPQPQSALRGMDQAYMMGIGQGPAPARVPRTRGQTAADMLGAAAIGTTLIPVAGDIAGVAADAAMYAAYPEERTLGNYAMSALGVLPLVPAASALKALKNAPSPSPLEGTLDMSTDARMQRAEKAFTAYHGTPHVIGESQRLLDLATGKEYVSDPAMASRVMEMNPGKYQVLGENPLGMFDLNRMGSGEGAQAFGAGVYSAEAPDIARGYRGELLKRHGIDDVAKIGDKEVGQLYSEIENRAVRLPVDKAQQEYEKLQILEQLMIDGDVLGVMSSKENYSPQAYSWFESNVAKKYSRPGALYEVQINAPQERLLDWDAPIADQSPEVRDALTRAGIYNPELENRVQLLESEASIIAQNRDPVTNIMRNERRWHDIKREIEQIRKKQPVNMRGEQAYYRSASEATNQMDASKALLNLGIPGIRYLDQGSRMAGEGTRNFVIFDPKLMDITAKYGVAGSAVGLSALRNIQRDEEPQPD